MLLPLDGAETIPLIREASIPSVFARRRPHVLVSQLPHGYDHPNALVKKNLQSPPRPPPVVWVVVHVSRRDHSYLRPRRQHPRQDVPRPPRVVIRRHHQYPLPSTRADELSDRVALLAGIRRPMLQQHNCACWDAPIHQVMLLKLRDARIRPQIPPARDNSRRPPRLQHLRRARRSISFVVIIAQNHDPIRRRRPVIHHPETTRQPHQWMPHQIDREYKARHERQKNQPEKDSAPLRSSSGTLPSARVAHHVDGSACRNRSAACSGKVLLK